MEDELWQSAEQRIQLEYLIKVYAKVSLWKV
jgi:hypothetical protein